jgi:hypothetical protein
VLDDSKRLEGRGRGRVGLLGGHGAPVVADA